MAFTTWSSAMAFAVSAAGVSGRRRRVVHCPLSALPCWHVVEVSA